MKKHGRITWMDNVYVLHFVSANVFVVHGIDINNGVKMFKVTKIISDCKTFFSKNLIKKTIYGFEVDVESNVKYVVVTKNGVMYGFIGEPEYKGHWKCVKENPTPIARVEFEGDFLESKVKIS